MRTKAYLVLSLVVVLSISMWVAAPAQNAIAQSNQDQTTPCDHASTELVGPSADLPKVKGLIHDICNFNLRTNQVPRNVSKLDKQFVEAAIASNQLEIQSLQYAIDNTTNEEWKGLLSAMLTMHTADLQMAMEVAKKIGANTKPDLTNARVFPETPDYDLGIRRVNLEAEFLEPLMSAGNPGGSTPTSVPTEPTNSPTLSPPTATGTGLFTNTPVSTPTGTATLVPPSSTPIGMPSNTPGAALTGTLTVVPPSSTPIGMPSNTPGGTLTGTAAVASPTGTSTAVASNTPVPTLTGTSTAAVPTNTGVATTPAPGTGAFSTFDALSLSIIYDEHVMDVETALAAERLVKNNELQAFAKHSADMAQLHILLMKQLKYRLIHNITLPAPDFERDYQSPRKMAPVSDNDND